MKLENAFEEELRDNKIYNNSRYASHFNKMEYDWQNYINGIEWIDEDAKTLGKFEELNNSINKWIDCKILSGNKRGYISVKIPDYEGIVRIKNIEILDIDELVLFRTVKLRIRTIDKNHRIIYLSQRPNKIINQPKIDNFEKFKIQLNKIETCKIINIVPDFLEVITETGLKGTIHNSQVSIDSVFNLEQKFRIGQSVSAVIIGLGDNKGVQLSIKKYEFLQKKSDRETDLGIKLKNALLKGGLKY